MNTDRPGHRPAPGIRSGRRSPGRARLAGLLAALAAAALLAACSSSSSTSGSAAGSSSAATGSASAPATSAAPAATGTAPANDVGITPTTIRLAMVADVNTAVAPGLFQKSVNAVNAWADMLNANGGLAGRKVVVDFCDGKLDPNATTNCVIKACQNDFAMVGTQADALVDLSDIDGCKNAQGKPVGIPNLAAFAFLPLACDPDTYTIVGLGPYCATAKQNPQTYLAPVGDMRYYSTHFQNLHGIYAYDSDVPTLKINFFPQFQVAQTQLGIKPDGQGNYPLSGAAPQSALTPIVSVLKSSNSSFVYNGVTPQNLILMEREAKLQGVNSVKVWACDSGCYDTSFIQQGGATVNGTYANLNDLPFYTDYQGNAALSAVVKQVGGINNINNNAIDAYITALLFQDVVNKAVANGGTLNRQTVFTALKNENAFNAQGIIGTTNIGARQASTCFALAQVQNGQWQRVFPTKPGTFDCSSDNIQTVKMNIPL